MAFQIRGKLEFIGPTTPIQSKKDGSTFYRREFVIDCTRFDQMTGQPYENHPRFELSGNSCTLIDHLQLGQFVDVKFSLRGTKYTDQQTGQLKYFTTINAFGVELVAQNTQQPAMVQSQAMQQSAPQAVQQPMQPSMSPSYPQQGYQSPQAPSAAPQQSSSGGYMTSQDIQRLQTFRDEVASQNNQGLPF